MVLQTSNVGDPIVVRQNYNQGNVGGLMQVILQTSHLPIGTSVSMSASCPGPNPPVYVQPTSVTTQPMFITGIESNIPANWSCDILITVQVQPGVALPPDASVSVEVAFQADTAD